MDAITSPLAVKNDLLTGMEWNPAQVRDFFHLAADIKAHPEQYRTALCRARFWR